jgi:hypothetical protein
MGSKCITSILTYGMGTTGKTTQFGELAKWIKEKFPTSHMRLISCSSGWEPLQPFIDIGWIKAIDIRARAYPFETIDKLSKGWWPLDLEDPAAPLVPWDKQTDFPNVMAVGFDGLTEISEWLMGRATQEEAKGTYQFGAQKVVAKFRDGATDYAAPSQADYGVIQNHMAMAVSNSKQLAGRYVMWTALERRAVDEDGTRMPLYGPDLIGKAKTPNVVPWFGMALHLTINKDGSRSMWTESHFAEDGIPFMAVVRQPRQAVVGLKPLAKELKGAAFGLLNVLSTLEYNNELIKNEITKGSK